MRRRPACSRFRKATAVSVAFHDQRLDLTVLAIVRNGDPGGVQATALMPLDDLQRLSGLSGQINEILIANRGSATTSVELSGDVARAIRPLLIDDATAQRVFGLLSTGIARATVASLLPSLDGPIHDQIAVAASGTRQAGAHRCLQGAHRRS